MPPRPENVEDLITRWDLARSDYEHLSRKADHARARMEEEEGRLRGVFRGDDLRVIAWPGGALIGSHGTFGRVAIEGAAQLALEGAASPDAPPGDGDVFDIFDRTAAEPVRDSPYLNLPSASAAYLDRLASDERP